MTSLTEIEIYTDINYFPNVLGLKEGGLIRQYLQTSDSDSELFNIFLNVVGTVGTVGTSYYDIENIYFNALKAVFTTRIQDECLDKTRKQKYILRNILVYKDDGTKSSYKNSDKLYDNDVIFVECENETWIYVTNHNWYKITPLINENRYKSVSFFGSVNIIQDNWLMNCHTLQSVYFIGLNSLESIENSWLSGCRELKNVNFTGLKNLKSVGISWLFYCNELKSIDFTGLNKLEIVGKFWMVHCHNLKIINFTGDNIQKLLQKFNIRTHSMKTRNKK